MWNIISTTLGALGVVLAVIFYLKSRTSRRISYVVRSFTLLGKSIASIPHFRATYEGEALDSLIATKVLFWNTGNVTIGLQDVASTDPISIHLSPEGRILEARVLATSDATNSVTLAAGQADHSSCNVQFEYVDPRQGFVLSFLHCGAEGKPVRVSGTIKNGVFGHYKSPDWLPFIATMAMMILALVLMFLRSFGVVDTGYIIIAAFAAQGLAIATMMKREKLLRRGVDSQVEKIFQEDFDVRQITGQQSPAPYPGGCVRAPSGAGEA